MANQFVLLINLIGVFLFDAFFLADISITQNIPSTMTPGSEVRVTVTVNKGDLTGFAKLQLDLPPGMTATAIETKGASFTFSDQKAKFIWMALPTSPTFKVSYTLAAASTASGNLAIQGRFSYIEDNERKTFDLPTMTVDLGGAGAVPVAQDTSSTPEQTAQDVVNASDATPAGTTPVAVIDQASGTAPIQGPGGVSTSRIITPVTENEMIVEVVIKKGDLRGFGKLQETIPQGFTALEKNSDEAIFTTQDRIAKFVWLNLPAREEIKVVYKLRANDRPEGEYTIDGEFGYLLNDETQKAVTGSSKFFIGPKALQALQNSLAQEPGKEVKSGTEDPAAPTKEQETAQTTEKERPAPVKEKPAPVKEKPVTAKADRPTTIPAPEKGIVYKVQITAAHKEVGKAYFSARHKYTGAFAIERHQGWIKYVTGSFGQYKEARDQRVAFVQAGHNFPGPFVTAYNNGERITVQEALVISSQQWVQ